MKGGLLVKDTRPLENSCWGEIGLTSSKLNSNKKHKITLNIRLIHTGWLRGLGGLRGGSSSWGRCDTGLSLAWLRGDEGGNTVNTETTTHGTQ